MHWFGFGFFAHVGLGWATYWLGTRHGFRRARGGCPDLGKCLAIGDAFGRCPAYSCGRTQRLTDAERDECGLDSPYDKGRRLAAGKYRTARPFTEGPSDA